MLQLDNWREIRVSAPGSIMLMGEHAVLYGERAIACAVDRYMRLRLTRREDRAVIIRSALAEVQGTLDALPQEPRLSFVLATVGLYAGRLPAGFELDIESEFSHTVGLGSSAAVTAALVAALSAYAGDDTGPQAVFDAALDVIHAVQGRGSGTDLAASVQGGLIGYRVTPRQLERLPGLPEICLYYSGYKTRTPDVLERVAQASKGYEALYLDLYRLMGRTCEQAEAAILRQDWPALGRLMNIYQGLMDALGVNDATLAQMVYRLRANPQVLGCKISGSGLGDCVLALGADDSLACDYQRIPVAVSPEGVRIEYH
ncbi:mevalonate kinase [Marinobacterium nitratireducens]|uniref:Mevalonate kinase n=1 Tax=Marinobacterium nitratireducens TaxID=518897 RepID=A0A918DUT8_9GAMM|nr:mevalonate kinase [Marinobacterium nitratireducens]GGO83115.1 mevalonate kinase [Marinobacterium nitratireducens]